MAFPVAQWTVWQRFDDWPIAGEGRANCPPFNFVWTSALYASKKIRRIFSANINAKFDNYPLVRRFFGEIPCHCRPGSGGLPGAAAVFAKRAVPTPEIIAATNQLFEVLEKAGLDGQQAFDVYDTTFIFTLGSVRYEITRDKAVRAPLAQGDGTKPAATLLSRHATRMQSRDPDRQFEIGLDMILSATMARE